MRNLKWGEDIPADIMEGLRTGGVALLRDEHGFPYAFIAIDSAGQIREKKLTVGDRDINVDLLQACKAAQDCLLLFKPAFGIAQIEGELLKICERTLRQTQTAIAKATGGKVEP